MLRWKVVNKRFGPECIRNSTVLFSGPTGRKRREPKVTGENPINMTTSIYSSQSITVPRLTPFSGGEAWTRMKKRARPDSVRRACADESSTSNGCILLHGSARQTSTPPNGYKHNKLASRLFSVERALLYTVDAKESTSLTGERRLISESVDRVEGYCNS